MATLRNELLVDAYMFNSVGNAFVRVEKQIIPLPAKFVPCSPGPDNLMRVYSKIIFGNPPQEVFVTQTVEQLNLLAVQ